MDDYLRFLNTICIPLRTSETARSGSLLQIRLRKGRGDDRVNRELA